MDIDPEAHAADRRTGFACRADPHQLLALWQHEEIRIVARRPHDLEDVPDLPMRLRGAMGRKLAFIPSPARLGVAQNAFADLFGADPAHQTRPMTIDTDVSSGVVTIDLRLFGAARVHLHAVTQAMLAALEGGVTIRPGGRRVPFEPIDCLVRRVSPPWPAIEAREAVMTFVTPIVLRAGDGLSTSQGALLVALVHRVNGLARWAGVDPTLTEDEARGMAASVVVRPLETMAVHMKRWSVRNPGHPIPVSGFLGKSRLSGQLGLFTPYLMIARATHIGSHAALGFGRVEVALY